MEDHSFVVGQEFPDVKTFRNAVKEAAIAQHFELRIIKSDLVRYVAKCSVEDCPWRIRAVKLTDAPIFSIRSIETMHTCGKNALYGHQQASVDWIVSCIHERLRDNVNYKPKDISDDLYKQYGVTIPYKQAWRAKERGLAAIYGSSEEGFYQLPSYCEQVKLTNPGSTAEVFTTSKDNRFQSLFVSFYGSIYGFLNGCLPIVSLGKLQLTGKYLGTLLLATSFDPNGDVFPLAFGVADVASEENWIWFLSELHTALESNTKKIPNLIFISEGQNGVPNAVKKKFPSCSHAYCVKFLSEAITKEFKNSRLGQILGKAAESATIKSFKEKMAEIEEEPEAATWLKQYPPSKWASVYFEGTRYGHLSSNIDEFSQYILESRELPVFQLIEKIHIKVISIYAERHVASESFCAILTPTAERRMADAISRASNYRVLRSDEVEFEVLSRERSDIVNLGTKTCSCRGWQFYGIPCSHSIAAIIFLKKDVYDLVEKFFRVDSYIEAYREDIRNIPGKNEWKNGGNPCFDDDDIRIVRPPKLRRPPGRPEKKRLCMEGVDREKHTVRCSRCNQTGHYKTTCKGEITKSGSSLEQA